MSLMHQAFIWDLHVTLEDSVRDWAAGGDKPLGRVGVLKPGLVPSEVEVDTENHSVKFKLPTQPGPGQLSQRAGMLDRFVAITRPEDVVTFIQRYGPLGLCSHGVSYRHTGPSHDEFQLTSRDSNQTPPESCFLIPVTYGDYLSGCYQEPLDAWLTHVERVRAFLKLAWSVDWDRREDRRLWQDLGVPEYSLKIMDRISGNRDTSKDFKKFMLAKFVQEWLNWGGITLSFEWSLDGYPELGWQGTTWSQLGIQMIGVQSKLHELAICTYCHEPFMGVRARKTGVRVVCKRTECQRANARDRKRAQRIRSGRD